jgi:lipopolysaccharide export system protein LptA
MKAKIFLLLLAAVCGAHARADQGTNQAVITSGSGYFDKNARRLVYYNHVQIDDPRVKLWCERLTLDLPPQGRPTNVVAETNVMIDFIDEKGQTNHVTSDKAVYTFSVEAGKTNELVTFTGHKGQPPTVKTSDGTIYSEPLIWDRAAGIFHFNNEKVLLNQSLSGTNSLLPTQ